MSVVVQLGAHSVQLAAPKSTAMRRDVQNCAPINPHRALWAALGACWAGKPLKAKFAFNALAYGGEVFDELMALGIPEEDIYAAAGKAFSLCGDVPTEEAVARAEGFTAPQTEPSTP